MHGHVHVVDVWEELFTYLKAAFIADHFDDCFLFFVHRHVLLSSFFQGVHPGNVVVAAYGIEKKLELSGRRKHDSISDAEEGETWDQVIYYACTCILPCFYLHW